MEVLTPEFIAKMIRSHFDDLKITVEFSYSDHGFTVRSGEGKHITIVRMNPWTHEWIIDEGESNGLSWFSINAIADYEEYVKKLKTYIPILEYLTEHYDFDRWAAIIKNGQSLRDAS